MKERGMIFNGDMVRAIIDGRKTQTRRPILWRQTPYTEVVMANDGMPWPWSEDCEHGGEIWHHCPFGNVGDRIWVRETFALLGNEDGCVVDWNEDMVKGVKDEGACIYRASCEQKPGDYGLWSIPDDAPWKPKTKDWKYEGAWSPSSQMPRWASRITLEITGVRVERLHDISDQDAVAEGIDMEITCRTPTCGFLDLWESIYGEKGRGSNPWVWVIEFKVVSDD